MFKIAIKIIQICKKKRFKISLAESCTGGLTSSMITSVSGASKVFDIGLITYSNKSKINILKVPKKIIKKYGSVSKQCCSSMLHNLMKITKTNIALAITGIAGPKGGSLKKPVGLVYIGIKINNKTTIKKFLFKKKKRIQIQKASANEALKLILLGLSKN